MKNLKWKEALIEHVEKGVLGLVALFVIFALVTTDWSKFARKPAEYDAEVTQQRSAFSSSTWPETAKTEFDGVDPGYQVDQLLDGAPTYEYSTRFVWPLNKRKEKIREPMILALEDPVSDASRILLEVLPAPAEDPASGLAVAVIEQPKKDDNALSDLDDVDAPRGVDIDGPRNAAGRGTPQNTGNFGEGGEGEGEDLLDSLTDGEDSGFQAGRGMAGEAKGTRFVAIRAVFPYRKQIEMFKRALNLETTSEAVQVLEFWDFELQRQTAQAGADPWSGKWEKVDIDYALNLLKRVDYDPDVVDQQFRDATMTMPLPFRVTGNWRTARGLHGILASHPRIKQLLSEKQQQEQEAQSAALILAMEKSSEAKKNTKGGFHGSQHDTRGYGQTASRNSSVRNAFSSNMQNFSANMASMANQEERGNFGNTQGMGNRGAFGLAQVTEVSDLLLFRFLDFSVVPGNAYRYRVRVTVRNPNYQRDLSELLEAESREGEFRTSEWSKPSNPSVVRDEAEFYLAKLDQRRGATVDVFQWMTETGSHVQGTFKDKKPGDRLASWKNVVTKGSREIIKDGIETSVLRPYEETYADEVIDYVTPNTLVDLKKTLVLKPEDHPDLQLDSKKIALSFDEIVMVNRFGELVGVDSSTQMASYNRARNRMTRQEKVWASLREQATEDTGEQTGIAALLGGEDGAGEGGGEEGMMQGMMRMGTGRGRQRSSLKRGGGAGGGMSGMMQMMMQQQMQQ